MSASTDKELENELKEFTRDVCQLYADKLYSDSKTQSEVIAKRQMAFIDYLKRHRTALKQELKQSLEAELVPHKGKNIDGWKEPIEIYFTDEVQKAIEAVFQVEGDNRE